MQVLKIKAGTNYHPEIPTFGDKLDMPVEYAIKQYAGRETIQLQWEEFGMATCLTIPSYNDTVHNATMTANVTMVKIKEMLRQL